MAVSYFDSIMASADGPLDEVFGKAFVYRRGTSTVELMATLQAHQSNVGTMQGGASGAILTESWHDHNFIITATELVLDGAVTLPQEGDELLEPNDDGSHTVYELMAPEGQRVYEPVDAEARKIFIFCKETRKETPTA